MGNRDFRRGTGNSGQVWRGGVTQILQSCVVWGGFQFISKALFLQSMGSQDYGIAFSGLFHKMKKINVHISKFLAGGAWFYKVSHVILIHRVFLCPCWNTPHTVDPMW